GRASRRAPDLDRDVRAVHGLLERHAHLGLEVGAPGRCLTPRGPSTTACAAHASEQPAEQVPEVADVLHPDAPAPWEPAGTAGAAEEPAAGPDHLPDLVV